MSDAVIPPKKDWTVLVYAAGVNSLDSYLKKDIDELSHSTLPRNVDVVVRHVDIQGSSSDVHLSSKGPEPVGSPAAHVDSSASGTLGEFLESAIRRYPAKHYLVVLSSHGCGAGGVIEDDIHHTVMPPQDLKDALDRGRLANEGRPLDAVFFDACRMMAVEVTSELRGSVHVVVGSMDRISGPGYDLGEVVKAVSTSGDARQMGYLLVGNEEPRQAGACNSLSAIDLDRTAPLETALTDLSRAVMKLDPVQARRVRQISLEARRTLPSPDTMDVLDQLADDVLGKGPSAKDELKDWIELSRPGNAVAVRSFCTRLLADAAWMADGPLSRAARAVVQAHDEAVFSYRSNYDAEAGGLSISLPLERLAEEPLYSRSRAIPEEDAKPRPVGVNEVRPLAFEVETGWDQAVSTVLPVGVPAPLGRTPLEEELNATLPAP